MFLDSHPSASTGRCSRGGLLFALAVLVLLSAPLADEAQASGTTAGLFLCKYKPNYFVLGVAENGDERPTTKFQFSFRYVLWDFRGDRSEEELRSTPTGNRCADPSSNHQVNFGYTQKSIWKLYDASAPFEENNYNPEIYYSWDTSDLLGWGPLDWLTVGFEHESNGEDDPGSRSWNRIYFQLRLLWEDLFGSADGGPLQDQYGRRLTWQARFYLKAWAIFPPGTDSNTDYGRNLGHFRVIGVLQSQDYDWGSFVVDAEASAGDSFDRGQLQLGLSWGLPFKGVWRFVPHLYGQYFVGHGETLIRADRFTHAFRLGLRLER